jgi:hypothetical protein
MELSISREPVAVCAAETLVQKIIFLQPLRHELFGDVADVFADEQFESAMKFDTKTVIQLSEQQCEEITKIDYEVPDMPPNERWRQS